MNKKILGLVVCILIIFGGIIYIIIRDNLLSPSSNSLAASSSIITEPNGAEKLREPYQGLPTWFDSQRVQLGGVQYIDEYKKIVDLAVQMGTHVAVIDVWTSKKPDPDPSLVAEAVAYASSSGVTLIGYRWPSSDPAVEAEHPHWVCHDVYGDVQTHDRGDYLDFTSGWGKILGQRVLALAQAGLGGVYFDDLLWPDTGCFGTQIQEDFVTETGRALPTNNNTDNPDYIFYLRYEAKRTPAVFAEIRNFIHSQYPNFVILTSLAHVSTLTSNNLTSKLAEFGADSAKNEFRSAIKTDKTFLAANLDIKPAPDDIRMAFGYSLLRDAADGRPPHIWDPGMTSKDSVLGFVSAITTYGGIVDLRLRISDPGEPPRVSTSFDDATAGFALGNLISPYLGLTRPVHYAAVLYSEVARNHYGFDTQGVRRV